MNMNILSEKSKSRCSGIVVILIMIIAAIAFMMFQSANIQKQTSDDVEIIIKEPVKKVITPSDKQSRNSLITSLKNHLDNQRKTLLLAVDANEFTISEFWKQVLDYFSAFEYYSAIPEAFLRRTMVVVCLWRHNPLDEEDDETEFYPKQYPDNDWHSLRYRASLVPDTIDKLKYLINLFFDTLLSIFPPL